LIVEITEDLLLDDIDRTREVLETLRKNSIHVALDDFGSGYSALTYLRELPIDEVKLDQDLIIHVLTDPRAEAIVRAVIELAHSLNVTTVAEGVETAEIASWLRMRSGARHLLQSANKCCGGDGFDHIASSARLTHTAGFEHARSGGFQSVGGARPIGGDSCAVGRFIRAVAQYFSVDNSRLRGSNRIATVAEAQLCGRGHVGNAQRFAWSRGELPAVLLAFRHRKYGG